MTAAALGYAVHVIDDGDERGSARGGAIDLRRPLSGFERETARV